MTRWLTMLTLGMCLSASVSAAEQQGRKGEIRRLAIEPALVSIKSTRDRVQLVISAERANGQVFDVTRQVKLQVEPADVVAVSATGAIRPLKNGKVQLTASLGKWSARTEIDVSGQDKQDPISFHLQTLPVLAKAGCSGGSCHGSPNGKAGFRLSLLAFDPASDAASLTRDALGRRVNPLEPAQSLLLLKPTMRMPHEGGRRLRESSDLYQWLHDWIGEGCHVESTEIKCVGIELSPAPQRLLAHPDWEQQFRVVGQFSDGSRRDVTSLAIFQSSDEKVLQVGPNGLAKGVQRGEAAVIARYLEFIDTSLVTLVENDPKFRWISSPDVNYVDEHVGAKLRKLQFAPSTLCNDEVFVRRVFLDVIGVLPTPEEAQAFLKDSRQDKRARLIDQLLERPEFGKFWAQKWGDLLRVSVKQIGRNSVYKYNRWLERSWALNQPYDEFARQLITASGSTLRAPQGNYYRTAIDTNDALETTAQIFLGTRIQCAKCHNHPFERWTQNNYYGLAAFFHRVGRMKTGRGEEVFLYATDQGDLAHPQTGKVVPAWVPVTGELALDKNADRRNSFVRWLVRPENPFFTRVEVNRIWANLLGRGIVEPFDDFRDSNPPANAALLDALAADFAAKGYDRKHIIRTILNSRTYQTSSRPNSTNLHDEKYFSRYPVRRLTAEQFVDAIGQVTGRPKQFEFVAANTKATWLPAPDLRPQRRDEIGNIEFLKVFGQPERQSVCECERGDDTSLGQALQLLNGSFVNQQLTDVQNRFHQALKAKRPPAEIINELYLRGLCRAPTAGELTAALDYFAAKSDKQKAMEDICWAILNKDEFLFQH